MDDLISKLMPQAKCVEDPIVPDLAEDPMTGAVAEQEEMMGGGTGDFKSAMEFRGIGHRRALFSTEMDKIDGFKLSFSMPVSPSFMMQHKWMLYPPQNSNPNPMMDMMMPPKSSHYEMDVYYIHGMPDSEPMSGPMDIDISKMTHFRGSRKASGAVEAMIMKVLSKNIDFRFEGFFRNVGQGQWNATINHKSKLNINSFTLGNMNYSFASSHLLGRNLMGGFELFYMQKMLDINFAALARYKNKCASFTLNKMQMESAAGFTMKLDRTTSIGTELVYNLMEGVSYTNFAYTKSFRGFTIKALFDSNGKFQSCFNMTEVGRALKLKTYASGNIFKDSFKFGYGIHIGSEEI